MSLILPRRLKTQPQYPAPLKNPGFWRLVDIQSLPPYSSTPISRTLEITAKLGTGQAGKCVDFVAPGDWLSYGANSALQLSTMTGLAVVEMPAGGDISTLLNTCVGGAFSAGFVIRVLASGTVGILKQDVVALADTTAKAKRGTGASNIAWSYNNVTGSFRVAIDGVLETFSTTPQTYSVGIVGRNRYYENDATQAGAHKQYLFALSAECDRVTNAELREWSLNPWGIFKAPSRRLWTTASSGGTTHDLVGAGATQSNATDGGTISQAHVLTGAALTQANASATDAITQSHDLAGTASAQANAAAIGGVTQTHALTGSASAQSNTASTGAVTQGAQFAADSVTQANASGTGAITQTHALSGVGSTQPQAASAASITQTHALTGTSATQANVAAQGAISQGFVHDLAAAASTQTNTDATGAITQAHVLVSAPSIQDNIAAASAIVQAHVLAALSATQGNSASSGAVTAGDNVLVSIVERTATFRRSKSVTVRFN